MTVKIRKQLSPSMFHFKRINPTIRPLFLVQSGEDFAIADTLTEAFNHWSENTTDKSDNSIAWSVHPESQITEDGLVFPEGHPPKLIGSFNWGRFSQPC